MIDLKLRVPINAQTMSVYRNSFVGAEARLTSYGWLTATSMLEGGWEHQWNLGGWKARFYRNNETYDFTVSLWEGGSQRVGQTFEGVREARHGFIDAINNAIMTMADRALAVTPGRTSQWAR